MIKSDISSIHLFLAEYFHQEVYDICVYVLRIKGQQKNMRRKEAQSSAFASTFHVSDSRTSWLQLLLTVLFHLPSNEMMTYNGLHSYFNYWNCWLDAKLEESELVQKRSWLWYPW